MKIPNSDSTDRWKHMTYRNTFFNSFMQWLLGCPALYITQILQTLTLIFMSVIIGFHVMNSKSRFPI